jgi:hypothetical protein
MSESDSPWVQWHSIYEIEGSPLQLRVAIVQRYIRAALDAGSAAAPFRILSLCAGQGRDVVGALAGHPRRAAVRARLVELDPELAAYARRSAAAAGLHGVEVVNADASTTGAAAGAVPADLLLLCGIFGNISDDDIRDSIGMCSSLCAPGATVIWTRHRRPPDLTPRVREWFVAAGFEEVAFESPDEAGLVGVGVNRLAVPPAEFEPGRRLFTFYGDGGIF